jgi:hypothetical protein
MTEITEVFDPLLEILVGIYEFQHHYVPGDDTRIPLQFAMLTSDQSTR